jgi:Rod binding domain-containing protein
MRIREAATATTNPSASLPPRLVQAAHEFEAQMMKELLKPAARSISIDGDDSDSGSGGALADFATEALGQSLSRSGGLGIAKSILCSFSRSETTAPSAPNPGEPTWVMPPRDVNKLK